MIAKLRQRLVVKFLAWLMPTFLVASAAALYLVAERDLRQEIDFITARVGNHAGRVAAALARDNVVADPVLAADLVASLLSDRAVRCAEYAPGGDPARAITEPRGIPCDFTTAAQKLEIPIDDLVNDDVLAIALDFTEIVEARRERRNLALGAILLGALVATISSLLAFWRTVSAPLSRLLRSISGEGRAFEPVANASGDEIGVVIDNYNELRARLDAEAGTLRASRDHIDRLYNTTPAPILCVAPNGVIVEASDYWLEFSGHTREETLGAPLSAFMRAPADRDIMDLVRELAAATSADNRDVLVAHRGKRDIDAILSVVARAAPEEGYLCVATDVSGLRQAQRALQLAAVTDKLTGLPNRAAILDVARDVIRHCRADERVTALYIDLDNFKQVNDTFGHDAGDRLIIEAVRRIKEAAGPHSGTLRLGGDEFAVFLRDDSSGLTARTAAKRIIVEVSRPIDVGAGVGFVSASVGIAPIAREDGDFVDGLHRADLAMYEAKQEGKNRFAIYSEALEKETGARNSRALMIREGLDDNWFSIAWQPIVDLETLRTVGAEALLRVDEQRASGRHSPADIVRTAEETGQIEQLGAFVLDEALKAGRSIEALASPGRYVSINISARQINDNLLPTLRKALERAAFPPACLVIEITETAVISRFDKAVEILESVRALGAQVALDDFGVGYSSLAYLNRLPVDIIKLDRSLILGLQAQDGAPDSRRRALALIRSITSLARDLGVTVIAEGIETQEVARTLAGLGVDRGQGYLYSPALPAPAFRAWIDAFETGEATNKPNTIALRRAS